MTDNELLLAISEIMDKKNTAMYHYIDQKIDEVNQKLSQEINEIKIHLENVTDRNIQLLAENYLPAAKKYETETAKIEAMQSDINVMKSVIREHSEKLQKIS